MSDIEAIKHALEIGIIGGVPTALGTEDAKAVLEAMKTRSLVLNDLQMDHLRETFTATIERQAAEIERLRAIIAGLEWLEDEDSEGHKSFFCPYCGADKRYVHDEGCKMAAAIAALAKGGE